MKLQVRISTKRIKEAIAEGIILPEILNLDVNLEELSKEDRELLSRNVEFIGSKNLFTAEYISENGNKHTLFSDSEKIEGILSEMRKYETIRKEKIEKEKIEKKIKDEIDDILENVDSFVKVSRSGYYLYFKCDAKDHAFKTFNIENTSVNDLLDYVKSPLFLEKIKEVESVFKTTQEKQNKEFEKNEEKNKLKEIKKEELRKWGLDNGSDLLKARIEENFNWQELANDEYFQSICPENFQLHEECDDYDECWNYNNPTLEHINALREAKKIELFTKVYLRKCKKVDDYSKTFFYFVVAEIQSFDTTFSYIVSKELGSETIYFEEEE